MKKYQNFINGKWCDAKSGKTFENRNPANWDEVVGTFPKSGAEDVEEAVGRREKRLILGGLFPRRNAAISSRKSAISWFSGRKRSLN